MNAIAEYYCWKTHWGQWAFEPSPNSEIKSQWVAGFANSREDVAARLRRILGGVEFIVVDRVFNSLANV